MVQAVILEDRSSHRDELLSRLAAWPRADRLELRCAATAEELRCLLQAAPADILLTDIDLGEGEGTGIQLVREMLSDGSGTQVIYITGYPLQFCTMVYQTEHIYFLTKPLRQQELFDALDKAMQSCPNGPAGLSPSGQTVESFLSPPPTSTTWKATEGWRGCIRPTER